MEMDLQISESNPSVRQLKSYLNKPSSSSVRQGGYSKAQERAYTLSLLSRGAEKAIIVNLPERLQTIPEEPEPLPPRPQQPMHSSSPADRNSNEQSCEREIAQLRADLQSLLVSSRICSRSLSPFAPTGVRSLKLTRNERLQLRPPVLEKAPRSDRNTNTTAVETPPLPPPRIVGTTTTTTPAQKRSFVTADDEDEDEPLQKRRRYEPESILLTFPLVLSSAPSRPPRRFYAPPPPSPPPRTMSMSTSTQSSARQSLGCCSLFAELAQASAYSPFCDYHSNQYSYQYNCQDSYHPYANPYAQYSLALSSGAQGPSAASSFATNHYAVPAADTIAFPIELPVGSTSNAFLSDSRWPSASAPATNPFALPQSNWNWNSNSNRVALYTTHPMCVNPIGYENPSETHIPLPPQSQAQASLHWGAPVPEIGAHAEHSSSKANTESDSSSDSGSEYTGGEAEPQSYVSRRLHVEAPKQQRKRKRSSGRHTHALSTSETSATSVTSASGCAFSASRTETADTARAAASTDGSVSGSEEASGAASASLVSAAPGASQSAAPGHSNASGGIDQPDGAPNEAHEKEPGAEKQDSLRPNEAQEQKPPMSYVALIASAILSRPERQMCLSDIYAYIGERHAYFASGAGARKPWRNAVRHNLSINECFVKRDKTPNGRGHFWAVHPACLDAFLRGDFRRRHTRRRVRHTLSPLQPHGSLSLPNSAAGTSANLFYTSLPHLYFASNASRASCAAIPDFSHRAAPLAPVSAPGFWAASNVVAGPDWRAASSPAAPAAAALFPQLHYYM